MKPIIRYTLRWSFVFVIVCLGCDRNTLPATFVPGNYKGTYGGATEYFKFDTNGVFVQTLYVNGEAKYTNQGSWKIEKRPGKLDPTSHIALRPFVCAIDTRTRKLMLPPMEYEPYYADWDAKKQQIEFNLDAAYYLIKTDDTDR